MTQKTIAQQLKIKDFPFVIRDKNGNEIYYENSIGEWCKNEYDSKGNCIYYEESSGYWSKKDHDSNGKCIYYEDYYGTIEDNRPKSLCEGKIVEIDGKKYQLKELI